MDALKQGIAESVDDMGDELAALSSRIHAHPELAFEERRACGWIGEFLARRGFRVETGVGGVETAFRASLDTGPGPTLAILCEYDALPGIGHACGHNVIAAAGAGAGAALMALRDRLPGGRIQVIGTPAEERGGGKGVLVDAGVFKGVDAAMMIHGFDRTLLHQDLLGVVRVTFEWVGRAAHASTDPWEGVNALDACVATFNAVAMLRQQMRPDCRIHGIVADGGRRCQHHPGARGRRLQRARAEPGRDVGALPPGGGRRRGRGHQPRPPGSPPSSTPTSTSRSGATRRSTTSSRATCPPPGWPRARPPPIASPPRTSAT